MQLHILISIYPIFAIMMIVVFTGVLPDVNQQSVTTLGKLSLPCQELWMPIWLPPMKWPLTRWWMLKWKCKHSPFHCRFRLRLTRFPFFSDTLRGLVNNGYQETWYNVHYCIMFWLYQLCLLCSLCHYVLILLRLRFVSILVFGITNGRTDALHSQGLSMIWEINFVQPCIPVGWLISRKLMVTRKRLPPLHPAKIRTLWSWNADVQLSLPVLPPRG